MVIILCLYAFAMWAVFAKFKLVRWSWLSGTVSIVIGAFILATFMALFNYLTPSGKVTVTGRVVEVTPNVSGEIVAIPVKPNVPVKKGDVLFQIEPAPFQYKVAQLRASLAAAQQQTKMLQSNYEQATANVAGLDAQQKYNAKRLDDIQRPFASGANTEFKEQDTQVQYETVTAQLNAARATQQSAKLALDSEIGGINTSVALGAPVDIVFDNAPGRIYHAKITAIPKGIGQGQLAVSGRSHAPRRSAARPLFLRKFPCPTK